MKPNPELRKKTDPAIEKLERGSNAHFRSINRTPTEELNLPMKQEDTKLKRYQSRNKNVRLNRDSLLGSMMGQPPMRDSRWASKSRSDIDSQQRSPSSLSNRVNNKAKEEDHSELIRKERSGGREEQAQTEPKGLRGQPWGGDL